MSEEPWTVLRLIRWSTDYLTEKGIEQGRLDSEHLLAHALDVGRLQLYLEYDRPLIAEELDRFRPMLQRRARREPLQHVVGRTGFRELELKTDNRALIPRPETEVLVDLVLDWARGRGALSAVDIGTGSGCIALSLAKEGPFEVIRGIDISEEALELARENAAQTGLEDRVEWLLGSRFQPLPDDLRVDVVVSNPPYIGESERPGLQPEVRDFEPALALFSGADGSEMLTALIEETADRLKPEGLFAVEVGLGQAEGVREQLAASGAFVDATVHEDYTRRPRFVTAVRG